VIYRVFCGVIGCPLDILFTEKRPAELLAEAHTELKSNHVVQIFPQELPEAMPSSKPAAGLGRDRGL
jgi:hypothetical protein